MKRKELVNSEKSMNLPEYMSGIIRELKDNGKFTAVHTYTCTLHSFTKFCNSDPLPMTLKDVFTPGRLKAYQSWMLTKGLSLNTISTYLRTLRAVYNRIFASSTQRLPDSGIVYAPKLFADVYTKVQSRTKRSLTEEQMRILMNTDPKSLPVELRCTLAHFQLMFLFRGMPFIDLAHLRKCDVHGNMIIYCRHKTGRQITVKIPATAFPLLKEYRDMNSDSIYLFPILDGRLRGAEKLHHNYLETLSEFNRNLGKLAAILLPGNKLSSYTVRHTWATLSFYLGTNIALISESLGHSSIRVTETYLKPFGNKRMDSANNKLISYLTKKGYKAETKHKAL